MSYYWLLFPLDIMVTLQTRQRPALTPPAHPMGHRQGGDSSHTLLCLLAPNPNFS